MESRRQANYPPFGRLGLIRIESPNLELARQIGHQMALLARNTASRLTDVQALGPANAPIERIRDRHRQMIMVLAPTAARLVEVMSQVKNQLPKIDRQVNVMFDVDPFDLL